MSLGHGSANQVKGKPTSAPRSPPLIIQSDSAALETIIENQATADNQEVIIACEANTQANTRSQLELARASLQLAFIQATAAGGGFMPYEISPF
jgi:hypothetical protein